MQLSYGETGLIAVLYTPSHCPAGVRRTLTRLFQSLIDKRTIYGTDLRVRVHVSVPDTLIVCLNIFRVRVQTRLRSEFCQTLDSARVHQWNGRESGGVWPDNVEDCKDLLH